MHDQAPLLRQHADYVDPWTFANARDLALLRLRRDLDALGFAGVLEVSRSRRSSTAR